MSIALRVVLLIVSNLFVTFAWYGHLRALQTHPVWIVILVRFDGLQMPIKKPKPHGFGFSN